jgi:protein involved in polysaccharide export with SLBB domain
MIWKLISKGSTNASMPLTSRSEKDAEMLTIAGTPPQEVSVQPNRLGSLRICIFAAVRLLAVVALLITVTTGLASAAGEDIKLRIGDLVSLRVPGEQALSADFKVDRQGQISLPEIGNVMVAGLDLKAAENSVRTRLSRVYRDLDKLSLSLKERKLLVAVLGYVKTPGMVEIADEASVQMAIAAAGGLNQGAQLDRVRLRRKGKEEIFDYKRYLDTGDSTILPKLIPLDEIFVPASPRTGNVQIDFDGRTLAEAGDGSEDRTSIKVFGEVNKPGIFAFKNGANAVDLIMRAGGVTRYASVEQIRIINKGEPSVLNLQTFLDSGKNELVPDLAPGATIFVPKQLEEIRAGKNTVYVMGEVAKPGAFDSKPGASFIDILANAGGPTRFAETRQIRLLKANGTAILVDLPLFTEGRGGKLPKVEAGDAIFVPEKTDAKEPSWLKVAPNRAIKLMGAVVRPGRYEWSDEMSILDLLAQAGGPTHKADMARIQIRRSETDQGRTVLFDLTNYLNGKAPKLPKLSAGAVIMVPDLPSSPVDMKGQWVQQAPEASIYIMGQVGSPGRYAFNTQMSFLDIIAAANGPTGSADLRNLRVSHRGLKGSKVSKVNLARYFETGDDALLPKVKPGDVIFVPDRNKEWLDDPKERTVRVIGAVGKPGRYRFTDDMTILDLLAEAGGPTSDALQSKIVVINMTQNTEYARLFDLVGFAKTGRIDRVPAVRAGDTVYVPNMSQSDWKIFMDGVKDFIPIVSLIALLGAL